MCLCFRLSPTIPKERQSKAQALGASLLQSLSSEQKDGGGNSTPGLRPRGTLPHVAETHG